MNKIILLFLFFPVIAFGAMDKNRCADAMVAALKAVNTNISGSVETGLNQYWVIICDELIKEIQTNATINMAAGDFTILPGTFIDSTTAPIVGLGQNNAFSLTGKIQ